PASTEAHMSWQPASELADMAFDHRRLMLDGVERARAKLDYSPLGAAFCPPEFTVAERRRVYETVRGRRREPRTFPATATKATGFLVSPGRTTPRDGGRPAMLYRRGPAVLPRPPRLRSS